MRHKYSNSLLLALTAFIWGSAFVAQSVGMDYIGPFTFNSIRCIMGGLILLPVIFVSRQRKRAEQQDAPDGQKGRNNRRILLVGGVCCGAALAAASSLQQYGLIFTTAGKAGFITALYILIVPMMRLFFGKKAGAKIWIGVMLAVIGMYFLCIKEGIVIAKGDIFVFLCAVVFSVHILLIDHFAPKVDGVCLSCIQFFVSGILCAFPMLLYEKPQIQEVLPAWMPLVYAGVFSCGIAYTLQIIGQKNMDPTVASLILSMESVFSAVSGWLILGERMSGRELLGCVFVFSAVILAQLPEGKKDSSFRNRKWEMR